MKVFTKTIGTILITAIVGIFTIIFVGPKKATTNKTGDTIQPASKKSRESLFI